MIDQVKHINEIIAVTIILVAAIIICTIWKVKPVPGAVISSDYGNRISPITGQQHFHNGIDLAAPSGTSVKSILSGKILAAGYDAINGNYVKIQHRNYQSFYGHLKSYKVKKDQYVLKFEKIGEVGNTGLSTGPHVHFMIWDKTETIVDPKTTNLIRL